MRSLNENPLVDLLGAKNMSVIRPCSTKAAYEGILTRKVNLNLSECSSILKDKGYELLAVTDYVMVVRKNYELTIFPSGRVVVKDINDLESAKTVIEKLHEDLGLYES
jgi:TATA-box binding protein (TBP) (component of TFIID and TFIIIB)